MRATRPALLLAFTLLGLACGGLADVELPEDRDLPVAPAPAEVAPPEEPVAPAVAPAPSEKPEAPAPAKAAPPESPPAPPASDDKGTAAPADNKGTTSASSDSKGSASADNKGSSSAAAPAGDSKGTGTKGAAPAETEAKGAGTKGAAGGTPNVVVEGEGKVVLVAGGKRYAVPGTVPPGPYDIEVAFPGEKAVVVGTARVREGQTLTIRCKAAMGICRPG